MEKLLGHLQPKLVAFGIAVEKDPRNFRSNKNLRERTTHFSGKNLSMNLGTFKNYVDHF